MTARRRLCLVLLAGVLPQAGCHLELTREMYEQVSVGDRPEQVRETLGWPDAEFSDRWIYVNQQPYARVEILFADQKVQSKKWSDSRGFETSWEPEDL